MRFTASLNANISRHGFRHLGVGRPGAGVLPGHLPFLAGWQLGPGDRRSSTGFKRWRTEKHCRDGRCVEFGALAAGRVWRLGVLRAFGSAWSGLELVLWRSRRSDTSLAADLPVSLSAEQANQSDGGDDAMNLAGKTFRAVSNSKNGHLNTETEMHFTSDSGIVEGTYRGGTIAAGHVLAKRTGEQELEMLYIGATKDGSHNAGKARATFSPDEQGRMHMRLDWQWLTGDQSTGRSEWVLVSDAT